jgi:hypothetical protein
MTKGFGKEKEDDVKFLVNKKELNSLLKKYKNVKKYMRSHLYQVKTLDGTEEYVKGLIEESKENPID